MVKYITLITFILISIIGRNAVSATYFVGSGGSDSNTGLSHAQRWATLAKVNNTVSGSGDDVYLQCDDAWNEALKIDWSGASAAVRAIVSSYYWNGSTEIKASCGIGRNRPNLIGAYDITLPVTQRIVGGNPGAIPSGARVGLIDIDADYVTVDNIDLQYSSGYCLSTDAPSGSTNTDIIVKNSKCIVSAGQGYIAGRRSEKVLFRNLEGTRCAAAYTDGQWVGPNHPVCNGAVGSTDFLMEKSFFYKNDGEAITVLANAGNVIINDNKVACNKWNMLRVDGAGDNVIVQNNMFIGCDDPNWERRGGPYGSTAIAVVVEETQNSNSTDVVIRNNVMADVRECFQLGIQKAAVTAGRIIDFEVVGNTCVRAETPISTFNLDNTANTNSSIIANNIFTDYLNECDIETNSDIVKKSNHWDTNPTDGDCDGINDVYGDPKLNKMTGWNSLNENNFPTNYDFGLEDGSSALNAGTDYRSTVKFTNEFSNVYAMDDAATCGLDLFTNSQGKSINGACGSRSATPDIGALEIGSAAPPVGEVTLPLFMNIGGEELNLSKTYVTEQYETSSGSNKGTSTVTVEGTNDDAVYQSWRGKNGTLSWSLPIANGNYDLTMLYQEQYWGVVEGSCTAAGSNRQFDVSVEGIQVRDEFDICALAGAAKTAVRDVLANIIVTDGQLDIILSLGQGQDPKPQLMGLEIIYAAPVPSPPANLIVR